MSAPQNPPAFPRTPGGIVSQEHMGMTMRDWFAGQALPAVIAALSAGQHSVHPNMTILESATTDAYAMADAMLAERAKGDAA